MIRWPSENVVHSLVLFVNDTRMSEIKNQFRHGDEKCISERNPMNHVPQSATWNRQQTVSSQLPWVQRLSLCSYHERLFLSLSELFIRSIPCTANRTRNDPSKVSRIHKHSNDCFISVIGWTSEGTAKQKLVWDA